MYTNFIKNIIDFFLSLAMLIFLMPVLIVTCIIIFLEDRKSPFFLQTRVGKNKKEFTLFKLRTMKVGSDKLSPSTSSEDPRITKTGKILRKTSIDELPQLLNVLLGQMSFIGPRPDLPSQQKNYSLRDWNKRHTLRPGLTGLAQCKYRSSATPTQRLEADLKYIEDCSFTLDARVFMDTLYIALKMKGTN